MISRERCRKAVEYLIDSAAEYGSATAEAVRAETMLKAVKALAMKDSGESAVSAQEREAYASNAYAMQAERLFEAVKARESIRAKRDAERMVIEVWRSEQANARGAERGFGSAA